jgi:dolichol-phosphate mannosyltransferase
MYNSRSVILIVPAYNEEAKIGEVIRRAPRGIVDQILVMDDGSIDRTAAIAAQMGAEVISTGRVRGVGYAIRRGFAEARRRGMDIAVTIAGNNKDAPEEITRLLDPICDEDYDFVVGSRYLAGGGYGGDMPFYRKLATRLHPALISLLCGKPLTESTNGYRALKVSLLSDSRIDLDQSWLDGYQLEVYLLIRILQLGYRSIEVPVTKLYPSRQVGNTKMRPIVDWWHMLSPILITGLGLEPVCAALSRTRTSLSPKQVSGVLRSRQ